MDANDTEKAADTTSRRTARRPPRLADYVWRPWFAKLWWIAIPLYWLPAGTPLAPLLEPYYTSNCGAVTNVLFMPLTAAFILGFGYLRRALARRCLTVHWHDEERDAARRLGRPAPSLDQTDPRSPYFWMDRHRRGLRER